MQTVVADHIRIILSHFLPESSLLSVRALGEGNINDTYLLVLSGREPVVLQRINGTVFPQPQRVADNVRLVTEYIREQQGEGERDEKKTLRVIPADNGKSCCLDDGGGVWRMFDYVAGTECFSAVTSNRQAYEGGEMLGWFHQRLEHLDPSLISAVLPGFHDLPAYCTNYMLVRSSHQRKPTSDLRYCCRQADKRLADRYHLQSAINSGEMVKRVIHGDPKIDNVLFAEDSGRAVALIDLDTVSPGIAACDIGDCLRSYCNVLGEDPPNPGDVVFDADICTSMLDGYQVSGVSFPAGERNLVYEGVRLLTYELGLRFLTDYLNNNRYFKVDEDDKNLRRAVVQFILLNSIEQQQERIRGIAIER